MRDQRHKKDDDDSIAIEPEIDDMIVAEPVPEQRRPPRVKGRLRPFDV
jgi:hypothetical protein